MTGFIVAFLRILPALLMALSLPLAGAAGAWWYDRVPPGWPNVKVGVLFFHVTLHAPGAGAVSVAQAEAARWRLAEAKAEARQKATEVAQAAVGASVAKSQQQAQAAIQWRTRTILKEVPTYVTPAVDRSYPLSVGWVRLHDAAALGLAVAETAGPSGLADDAASPVTESLSATVIAENYGSCRANAAELTGWQDWWRGVKAAQQ